MKTVLGLLLVLVMSTVVWAQEGGEGTNCGFSFVVEDHTCGDGCQVTTFYVDETGSDYYLNCQMTNCSDPLYSWCRATMTLKPVTGAVTIASCDNQGQSSCDDDFPASQGPFTLTQGVQYQLSVCMTTCPGGQDPPCSHCDDCVARAQVCRPE